MKKILSYLFDHGTLTKAQSKEILVGIAAGKYNESQIASFLTVFQMRSIKLEELAGFRSALQELCKKVDLAERDTIDMCGTGGDGQNTFNISTLSAFVVAGAGVKVTKHGNYGVSSICGSSNVLEYLGYQFTNDTNVLLNELDSHGICILHAPLFHPAMKNVAPIRKGLGVKTFFNMLGPLVNPAFPKRQMTGVFSLELARLYNYLLQEDDIDYTIVHSLAGYDEISLTSAFKQFDRQGEHIIAPSDIKSPNLTPESLFGGDTIEAAAKIFIDILEGNGTFAQNEAVKANAAVAIKTAHPDWSMEDAKAAAKTSIESKKALHILQSVTKDK